MTWALIRPFALPLALLAALVGWWFHAASLRDDLAVMTAKRAQAVELAKLSETLRARELQQGQAAFAAMSDRCDDRILRARESGAVIGEIVHGTGVQSSQSISGIVPASQLRRVIGQPAR